MPEFFQLLSTHCGRDLWAREGFSKYPLRDTIGQYASAYKDSTAGKIDLGNGPHACSSLHVHQAFIKGVLQVLSSPAVTELV